MEKADAAYRDIRTHNRSLIIMQIKTTPITMRIGQIKTITQTNAIRITMRIGTAGTTKKTNKTKWR